MPKKTENAWTGPIAEIAIICRPKPVNELR